jgi:hypothetical protein
MCARGGGDAVVAGHCQHVPDLPLLQIAAQSRVPTIDLVGGDPPGGHAAIQGAQDHARGQRGLGRERRILRYSGRRAPIGIARPGARQVELAVDQRVPDCGGVGQKHPDLGVLDPAGGAGVLPLGSDRTGPLLDVSGLVHDQHRVGVTEMFHRDIPHVVAHLIGIPYRPRQQVLHPVRRRVSGVLGDRPAVLARQVGQQSLHERARPPPWLHPFEPLRHPCHHRVELLPPAHRIHFSGV